MEAVLFAMGRSVETEELAAALECSTKEEAEAAARRVRELLERSPMPDMEAVARLDEDFITRNLSPGGCADLLAATYFLHDLARTGDEADAAAHAGG